MSFMENTSYASVDRIEGDFAILEVEQDETRTNDSIPFYKRRTFMASIPVQTLIDAIGSAKEGDVLIVSHGIANSKLTPISRCETERIKRVEYIKLLINKK